MDQTPRTPPHSLEAEKSVLGSMLISRDAAELAAYYSKARLSNLVQVDMIEAKRLNKPTGAKPGFVTYTGQKTLRVTPDKDKIESMRIQK